jgi:hypothetical protein
MSTRKGRSPGLLATRPENRMGRTAREADRSRRRFGRSGDARPSRASPFREETENATISKPEGRKQKEGDGKGAISRQSPSGSVMQTAQSMRRTTHMLESAKGRRRHLPGGCTRICSACRIGRTPPPPIHPSLGSSPRTEA